MRAQEIARWNRESSALFSHLDISLFQPISGSRRCRLMPIKIFLDDNSFHALKRAIPERSNARSVLDTATHQNFFDVIITCTESEARNLRVYASHCPKVVQSIEAALRLAGDARTD